MRVRHQKVLAVFLSLALLAGCLAMGNALSVSGGTAATVTDISAGVNEDCLIAAKNNLLGAATLSNTATWHGTLPASMYDGNTANVHDGAETWTMLSGTVETELWLTYDLGEEYWVDSVLFAGNGTLGCESLTVYVGDKAHGDLKTDSAAVPQYTNSPDGTSGKAYRVAGTRRIVFPEAVRGRYVVFRLGGMLNAGAYQYWISELAATGRSTANRVTNISAGVNEDCLIAAKDNLLGAATLSNTATWHGTLPASMYDGNTANVHDGAETWTMLSGTVETELWLTYDLGEEYWVDSVLFAGNGTLGCESLTVYVGDKAHGDLKTDSAAVPQYTNSPDGTSGKAYRVAGTRRIVFPEAVRGRYVVFRLGGMLNAGAYQYWISELAATGRPAAETVNMVCLGDSITAGAHFPGGAVAEMENPYSVQLEALLNAQSGGSVKYSVQKFGLGGSAVVAGSLIGDRVVSYYDGMWAPNVHGVQEAVAKADIVTVMLGTNDAANGTVDRWTNGAEKYYKQEFRKLVAALREKNPAAQIYIATSPVSLRRLYYNNLAAGVVPAQLELAAELDCGVIDVYNQTRDLVRDHEEHEAAFISEYEIDYMRVHPSEAGHAVIARAFYESLYEHKTSVSILRASETAAADAAVNEYAPVAGGYKGVVNDANRVPQVSRNLLAKADTVSGIASGTVTNMTNGVLPFVNSLSNNDHVQTNMGNIAFDLGRTSAVTQLMLGGVMTSMNQTAFLFRGYDVYITDDPAVLTVDKLAVSVHDLDQTEDYADAVGRLYTLPRAMSGRYVVMKLDTVTGGMWIGELAAIGYRPAEEKISSVGAQIRLNAPAGLRFAFTIHDFAYIGETGTADWDHNRTVCINNEDCTLVRVGALVGISTYVGMDKEALTLDRAVVGGRIRDVEAKKLYAVNENSVTYTAVVVNIPQSHYTDDIDARPYIQYLDAAGHLQTWYGTTMTRNYQQVSDG